MDNGYRIQIGCLFKSGHRIQNVIFYLLDPGLFGTWGPGTWGPGDLRPGDPGGRAGNEQCPLFGKHVFWAALLKFVVYLKLGVLSKK